MSKTEALKMLKDMSKEEAFAKGLIIQWAMIHEGLVCLTHMEQNRGCFTGKTINFAQESMEDFFEWFERERPGQNKRRDPLNSDGWYSDIEKVKNVVVDFNNLIELAFEGELSDERAALLADIQTLLQVFAIPEMKRRLEKERGR